MITTYRPHLSELVADRKLRGELASRIETLRGYSVPDPQVPIGEAELDAARAAGCLIALPKRWDGYASRHGYITDKEFAADLAVREVELAGRDAGRREVHRCSVDSVPQPSLKLLATDRKCRDESACSRLVGTRAKADERT